jgi:hypothetical protein
MRSRSLDLAPRVLLGILVLLLLWQVLRSNLPLPWLEHWPWRLTLVDASTAAGLAGGVAALVATRRQFAATLEPHLGWTSYRNESPILGQASRWRVLLTNSGGGRAIIRSTFYRVVLTGEDLLSSPWTDLEAARARLGSAGLIEDRDFALIRLGVGAGIGVGAGEESEVLALGERALVRVMAVDLHVLYDSAARDTYSRTMTLVPREGIPESLVAVNESSPVPTTERASHLSSAERPATSAPRDGNRVTQARGDTPPTPTRRRSPRDGA